MTVMQINPLLKTAMRQLKGIKLEVKDEEVVLTLLSRFSWFRVRQHTSIKSYDVMQAPTPSYTKVMLELQNIYAGNIRSACMQLQERYPWSGQAVQIRRRDFRRGEPLLRRIFAIRILTVRARLAARTGLSLHAAGLC